MEIIARILTTDNDLNFRQFHCLLMEQESITKYNKLMNQVRSDLVNGTYFNIPEEKRQKIHQDISYEVFIQQELQYIKGLDYGNLGGIEDVLNSYKPGRTMNTIYHLNKQPININ